MASIGIHSVVKLLTNPSFLPINNKPNQFSSPNTFLPIISNTTKKIQNHLVSSSITSSNQTLVNPPPDQAKDAIFMEKIDSWMQDSVSEIVKNLKEAPLLVQIYSENENGKMKIQTEKAVLKNWPVKKGEWMNGELKSPDGLIFVEELGQDYDEENLDQENENLGPDFGGGVSRAWGIVVQGKGVECGPACYLLKTNRVCGGIGLGFCTHFCLMRVSNLRDSALEQFKDSWLLQRCN